MFDISSSAYLSSVYTIITNLNYEKYVKYKELISNSLKRKKELETSISNLESSIKIIKNKQKNLRNENSLIIYDIKKMKGISSRIEETNKYLKNEVGGINYGKQCQLIKNETRIINSIIKKYRNEIDTIRSNIQKTNQLIFWTRKESDKINETKNVLNKHISSIKMKLEKFNEKNKKIVETLIDLSINE